MRWAGRLRLRVEPGGLGTAATGEPRTGREALGNGALHRVHDPSRTRSRLAVGRRAGAVAAMRVGLTLRRYQVSGVRGVHKSLYAAIDTALAVAFATRREVKVRDLWTKGVLFVVRFGER